MSYINPCVIGSKCKNVKKCKNHPSPNKFPLMLIDACEIFFLPLPLRFVPIRKCGYGENVADLITALFLCRCVFIISSFPKHFPLIEIASRSRNYISVYFFFLMRYKVTSLVCISLSLDASVYTHLSSL